MVVAVLGHAEAVKPLMRHGRRMRSSTALSALMWAAWRGADLAALVGAAYRDRLESVKLLLEEDVSGEAALYVASAWGHSEVLPLREGEGTMIPTCECHQEGPRVDPPNC